ncbi:MATE family efflux transporter [Enterovibrio sp. Hal110]
MNKRIVNNTFSLYLRQIFIVVITLYSVRVLLNELGVEGFGIYSVVAGFVSLLAFLPGSMASATQRFFSFAMGQNNNENLKKTFSANLIMYTVISLFAYLLLKTIGQWYVEGYLKIPEGRYASALELYNYTSIAFIVSIFTSPFIAIITAHEDMHLYAFLSVVDAVLKLGLTISLVFVDYDLLIYYGKGICVISTLITVIYFIICVRRYSECQFRVFYWDSRMLKEILAFTSWTLFGQISTVFRNQATTILVNQTFSPTIVAARVVALSVASQILVFSNNLNTGLYPPIIKSYAANEKDEMMALVFNGSKLTFF